MKVQLLTTLAALLVSSAAGDLLSCLATCPNVATSIQANCAEAKTRAREGFQCSHDCYVKNPDGFTTAALECLNNGYSCSVTELCTITAIILTLNPDADANTEFPLANSANEECNVTCSSLLALSAGVIAGIVLGSLFAVAIIVGGLIWYRKKKAGGPQARTQVA